MKKRLLLVLGATVLTGTLSWLLWPEPPVEDVRETAAVGEYVLSEYGGRVAVFCPRQGTAPRQITAIEVGLLPTTDRLQLQSGIPVVNAVELAMLLEDLGC